MATRDNRDYTRVLLYSYYTTITGWGSSYGEMWGIVRDILKLQCAMVKGLAFWIPIMGQTQVEYQNWEALLLL